MDNIAHKRENVNHDDAIPKSGAGVTPKRERSLHSPVTVLDNRLIDSPALLSLTCNSKSGYPLLVYLHFLQKRIAAKKTKHEKHKTPRFVNGRELTFSYEEAESYGINKRAFRNAIDHLIYHGFIDIVKHGNGLIKGECTIYGLSDRWEQYGTPDFQHVARQKVRFGFCEHSYPDTCSHCIHTLGGEIEKCVMNGRQVAASDSCDKFTRWE